jgi:Family of unknown function (DUF5996)
VGRFSGRPARPVDADRVTREAYTHDVISFGFWPGDDNIGDAAYYFYTAPEPDGWRDQPLSAGAWMEPWSNTTAEAAPWPVVQRTPLLDGCPCNVPKRQLFTVGPTVGPTSPAQWQTSATVHTLKTPHISAFPNSGSALTRKRSQVRTQNRPPARPLVGRNLPPLSSVPAESHIGL